MCVDDEDRREAPALTTRKGRAQLAGAGRHGFPRVQSSNRPRIPGQNDLGDSARQSTPLCRSPSQSRHVLAYHATAGHL